jgi:hypothetical protein
MRSRFVLLSILLFPLACMAEPATIIRATELKKDPASDAETLLQLAENTAVDALERKGAWTRVKGPGIEGWVKMLALRYGGPGEAKKGDTGVSQLFNVARTGTSGTQVTTGVRGLDPAMLAKAQPNLAEFSKMGQFAVTPDAAAGFAAKGRLQARQVEEVK